jgi:single-strand DNA-binding protein
MGRLTRDPEIRYTQGSEQMCIAKFSLAVDRIKKGEADFISCVAFGKNGEFCEKYLKKGIKIALEGRWQTGSYEKDGKKFYTNDCVVEHMEFAESKKENSNTENETSDDGFMSIPEGDVELPFV